MNIIPHGKTLNLLFYKHICLFFLLNFKKIVYDTAMDKIKLEIKNLCFAYIKKPLCLNGVNISVNSGEKVQVVGGEGMGKTTLLRILAGLETQYVGSIKIGNVDINLIPQKDRRLSYLPSEPVLFENKTLRYNLDYLFNVEERAPLTDEEVKKIFNRFSFNVDLYEKVKKLSITQKKIFAIIRSYIKNPEIVLIDDQSFLETNENLEKIKNAILLLVNDKNASKTAILASNDKNMLIECNKYLYLSFSKGFVFNTFNDLIKSMKDLNICNYINFSSKDFYLLREEDFYLCEYSFNKIKKKCKKQVIEKNLVEKFKLDNKFNGLLLKTMLNVGEEIKVVLAALDENYNFSSLTNSIINEELGQNLFLFEYSTGDKII